MLFIVESQAEREKTKGKGWFDLGAPEMTEEKKNSLAILKMRKVLDPKHFYKGDDMKAMPKYFQVILVSIVIVFLLDDPINSRSNRTVLM